MRRTVTWAGRSEFDRTAATIASRVETLRADVAQWFGVSAAEDDVRWQRVAERMTDLSRGFTKVIVDRLAENAATHEVLEQRIAEPGRMASITALAMRVGAMTSGLGLVVGATAAQRETLHDALAWYPTWSTLAPLVREPLVSVVVPTRNRRALLETALGSLERQTYSKWEAVVVDDGSTDDTSEYLRARAAEDDRIRPMDGGGVGCGAARQIGLERAQGDIIAYLDDDNLMAHGWLRALVEVLGRRPELEAVYGGQLREIDATEPWMLLEPFEELRLLEGNFIDIGAFAHRPMPHVRFRSDVNGLEDWEFILSISRSHRIEPVPVIASVYLERASGRLTLAPDHPADEQTVRAAAVRERLADPSFVEAALRSLSNGAGAPHSSAHGAATAHDGESLAMAIRNVAQFCGEPVRLLGWGIDEGGWDLGHRLGALGVVGGWFVAGPGEDELAREPAYDVVLVGGPRRGEELGGLPDLLSDGGVALVHEPDSSLQEHGSHVFESWRAFGHEWWIGSNAMTDFADVVPIRALLRGLMRG